MTTTTEAIAPLFARHAALYRRKAPSYQAVALDSLRTVWLGQHESLLDVGGGTGLMGAAIGAVLPVGRVHAIDVVDRFIPNLGITTSVYDGVGLPFGDASFDAATIINVLHHVPKETRPALFADLARVVRGPIYVKDHLPLSVLDHARLQVLDAIGNVPFGGMVRAWYLERTDWTELASGAGYAITTGEPQSYRTGPYATIFPNRLEVTLRLDRADAGSPCAS